MAEGIKLKIRGQKLRGTTWQEALQQKGVKQTGVQGKTALLLLVWNCKQWNASCSEILLHVYLLLMPLIKLTFCPTSLTH